MSRYLAAAATLLVLLAAAPDPAEARPARCFTTDDGHFACDFQPLDRQGSFEISGKGVPTYSLWVESPGVASGFVNLGNRNISLPGLFRRESADRACWSNTDTGVRVCAW